MNKKIAIFGAGLSGLSVAYHMGGDCAVYEQEERSGGLARTDIKDGFVFDYDGHLMHFRSAYGKKLIDDLLPGCFAAHRRNAWVYSQGVFTRYPFQANTFGLPAEVVKNCVLGMCNAGTAKKAGSPENFHDWMLASFGKGITRHFMYPYNEKFWNLPPERLISDWTQEYVPKVDIKNVLDGAFTAQTKDLGYNAVFWYPKSGGIEQIARALERRISPVHTGYRVKAWDLAKRKVYFCNGKSADYLHAVSTLPLVSLRDLIIDKIPARVSAAFADLRYISVFNLNLGISRDALTDKHWIYFPEKKFCFFRVGFPSNFSQSTAPKGRSSLYAEISYSSDKPLARKGIARRIIADLRACGILRKEDKVITSHINDIKYAYVVYDHNYRKSVPVIEKFLRSKNIELAGRFGRWRYMSMEDVLLDGKTVGESLRDKPCDT